MKLISRAEAKVLGLKRYYTGNACKHGHVAERLTGNRACIVCHNAQTIRSRAKDLEKTNAKRRAWNKNNPDIIKAQRDRSYKKNRAIYIESARNREMKLKERAFEHEKSARYAFYKNTPEGYEVDHEIPLKHELVCGLHCIANLQYLTTEANRKKSNKWSPDG